MKKQKTLEWLAKNLDVWPKTQKLAPNIDGSRWCKSGTDLDWFLFDDTNIGTLEDLTIYKSEWLNCVTRFTAELYGNYHVDKNMNNLECYINIPDASRLQYIPKVSTINDQVKNPKHYQTIEGFESITVIASALTIEQWKGFCIGNILKYRIRAGKKGDLQQDIDKADFYEELYEQHKHLCKV